MYTFVIGNGPSSKRFRGINLKPSIGCNFGLKDFRLDHLVCADRLAVHEVRKLSPSSQTRLWTKTSPLELPPGWSNLDFPGMDSGSAAIQLAIREYPDNPIICIGFDGVLGIDGENVYEYHFRPSKVTPEAIRQKHRETVMSIADTHEVYFACYQKHQQLRTMSYDQALKIAITQSRIVS